ncbi:MAG: hypothetical protein IIT65_01265 [Lachnospiraceae bacterium]|nr:hypothetical protein [Lachnospiraceae bacterium]
MAKNFLVDLNLNQNEVQNGVIQNLPSDPSNPIKGQVYFNTTTNRFRCYNGTTWDEMGTGGGTVTSVSIGNATNGGLSVSGSPITGAGTINIGHSNVLANAQTTSGIYPIKIDKNGHISEYGTAFDPSTKQNTISDLQTIREGAAAGATAVQPDDLNSYAPLASPALTGTPTAPTANAGTNTTQIATTAFVTNAISGITGAMVFKGTIGTGGTAGTALPTSNVKVGDTYKIITAGTYAGQAAKVGDLFIASATTPTWAYVPSGDDTDVTQVTAGAGLNTTGPDSSTDGGSITTSGTLNLTKTAVTPGTYQGITVDKYGRVTGASDQGYTTNEGTVTSVGITQGTGVSVSGGPVTTSGNITVGLADQLSAAQTTSGVYPIKVNKQGQITELGTAVTILKKYAADITGNASTTSFTITHNLGSRDITVQVYDGTTYEEVMVDITRTTTSAVVIAFAQAPASGKKYRVVCIG